MAEMLTVMMMREKSLFGVGKRNGEYKMKKKSEWKRTYEIYFKTCHLFLNDGYKTLHVGILLLLLLTSKESNNKKKQGEKDEKDVIRR